MGSSGFLLPMLARGVYREMLTQAWRRGAKLPNDHGAIKRAIGATELEWSEAWPQVSKYWRVDINNDLVNDTQLSVYASAKKMSGFARDRAKKAANTRWGHSTSNAQASSEALLDECTPSPSPSPSLISVSGTVSKKKDPPNVGEQLRKGGDLTKSNGNGHALKPKTKPEKSYAAVLAEKVINDERLRKRARPFR